MTTRERRRAFAGRVLRLDYDRPRLPRGFYWRVVSTCRTLGLRPVLVVVERTRRGWHGKVLLSRRCSPATVVALQAILGSDPHRETFNLKRVRALRRAPTGLRDRYSVLFRRKF